MAKPAGLLEERNEISAVASVDARTVTHQLCFRIKNFKLFECHKENGELKDMEFLPSKNLDGIYWHVKVKLSELNSDRILVNFELINDFDDATCIKRTVASKFVLPTGKLETFHLDTNYYLDVLSSSDYLSDGTLTLQFDLSYELSPVIIFPLESNFILMTELFNNSQRKLLSDFQNFYTSQKNSDAILRCAGEDIKAHKNILSARSPVFSKMFEHDTKENQENVVVIEDATSEVIRAMLRHVYCGKLDELTTEMYLQLYPVADKYDMNDLKSICAKCIATRINVDNLCEVALLAYLHSDQEMLSRAMYFFHAHIWEIVGSPDWANLISKHNDLVVELLKK